MKTTFDHVKAISDALMHYPTSIREQQHHLATVVPNLHRELEDHLNFNFANTDLEILRDAIENVIEA